MCPLNVIRLFGMLLAIMFIRKILLCKTVQKFIALGLTPIINMADKIAKAKEPILIVLAVPEVILGGVPPPC
jgi:hypothetical protein